MIKRILLLAAMIFAAAAPAAAQFADQATDAGTGAGTANAQTITLSNASSYADLTGVLVKFIPGATNTGDTTLAVNGFSTPPHVKKPTGSGMSLLTGGEFTVGQQVVVKLDSSGFFNLISPTNLPIGASGLSNSALSFDVPVNLQLNATVATNALTIAVKGNNGSDASATNPILIPFRNSTIATGSPQIVSLQSALSVTIASGSSVGCVSAQACRLWVIAICSTGLECTGSAGSDVVGVCVYNALSGTTVASIDESALQTSEAGTSGGNLAQKFYCNISAVTSRAVRILGYVDVQETTAGTWATGPTKVQLFGPGIRKPGEVVQSLYASISVVATSSTYTFPAPSLLSQSITLQSAANPVRSFATVNGASGGGGGSTFKTQIYRAVGASIACTTAVGKPQSVSATNIAAQGSLVMFGFDSPNTVSQITYGICVGITTTAGSAADGMMLIEEIMGSLEPANDNGLTPQSMVG